MVSKDKLHSVLQFSSSLDSQSSFGGGYLSAFTREFIESSIRKDGGIVYYSDITNALRDRFMGNDEQTPYFINQGTGREVFVGDAKNLEGFRKEFYERLGGAPDDISDADGVSGAPEIPQPLPSTRDLLMSAECRMGSQEEMEILVDKIFDGVLGKFNSSEFADLFDVSTVEHQDYQETQASEFMVRVLSRESRPDRLVTAEVKKEKKKLYPWSSGAFNLMTSLNKEWEEVFDLELNCDMKRAQFRLTLTPKYKALRQLRLILSCAPSLEKCYLFEVVAQHSRTDWEKFCEEGKELVKRWNKLDWDENVDGVTTKICDALTNSVRNHIEETSKRLTDE